MLIFLEIDMLRTLLGSTYVSASSKQLWNAQLGSARKGIIGVVGLFVFQCRERVMELLWYWVVAGGVKPR